MKTPPWFTDRSRYTEGFACPWKRLLRYHLNLEPVIPSTPQLTGAVQHRALELLLQPFLANYQPQDPIPTIAARAVVAALSEPQALVWESDSTEWWHLSELVAGLTTHLSDLVAGLTHGYARFTMPWLLENFEILHLEQEQTLRIDDHPDISIVWMSRPDMICRHKQTGQLSVHDFKTTSYWKDSNQHEWADSIQMMMQSYVASRSLGLPVPHRLCLGELV